MSKRDSDICRMKLLVVDSDPDANKIMCDRLAENYPTQCILSSHDAGAAWGMVKQTQPDIVLIDVCMPACDGMALTRQLMHEASIVVHISASWDYELINKCYEAGSKYFMRKPVHFERLFSKLDSLMVDLFYKRIPLFKGVYRPD